MGCRAGIAKLGSDWLIHAQPLKIWLARHADLPGIGPILDEPWLAHVASWAGAGFDLLVVPAAFTEITGCAHWEMLLRARAVENQCYVLAAAQGGQHPTGRLTHGNSMIVDPWGDILGRIDKGTGVVVADISAARINEVRSNMPTLRHRKL